VNIIAADVSWEKRGKVDTIVMMMESGYQFLLYFNNISPDLNNTEVKPEISNFY
jgi:hypothetical protein